MIVEGSLKTNALIALIVPLVVLAVPFLDTGFVVAKRIKYRRPVYQADSNHFHHRFHRIGFSQRRTVLYLYALDGHDGRPRGRAALRPVLRPRRLNLGWSLVMGACFVVAIAASVYLVLVLEILKLRRLRAWQLRHADPDTTEHEIDAEVERELETGEFRALEPNSTESDSNRRIVCANLAQTPVGLVRSLDRNQTRPAVGGEQTE